MPLFRHPTLPREQTVEHPISPGAGWVPVDDESTPEPPAEPVNTAPATALRDLTKEK